MNFKLESRNRTQNLRRVCACYTLYGLGNGRELSPFRQSSGIRMKGKEDYRQTEEKREKGRQEGERGSIALSPFLHLLSAKKVYLLQGISKRWAPGCVKMI